MVLCIVLRLTTNQSIVHYILYEKDNYRLGSDWPPETKQGIEGKIVRFRSGRVRDRVTVRDKDRRSESDRRSEGGGRPAIARGRHS